jgi:hypothetical protein
MNQEHRMLLACSLTHVRQTVVLAVAAILTVAAVCVTPHGYPCKVNGCWGFAPLSGKVAQHEGSAGNLENGT